MRQPQAVALDADADHANLVLQECERVAAIVGLGPPGGRVVRTRVNRRDALVVRLGPPSAGVVRNSVNRDDALSGGAEHGVALTRARRLLKPSDQAPESRSGRPRSRNEDPVSGCARPPSQPHDRRPSPDRSARLPTESRHGRKGPGPVASRKAARRKRRAKHTSRVVIDSASVLPPGAFPAALLA